MPNELNDDPQPPPLLLDGNGRAKALPESVGRRGSDYHAQKLSNSIVAKETEGHGPDDLKAKRSGALPDRLADLDDNVARVMRYVLQGVTSPRDLQKILEQVTREPMELKRVRDVLLPEAYRRFRMGLSQEDRQLEANMVLERLREVIKNAFVDYAKAKSEAVKAQILNVIITANREISNLTAAASNVRDSKIVVVAANSMVDELITVIVESGDPALMQRAERIILKYRRQAAPVNAVDAEFTEVETVPPDTTP